MSRSSRDHQPRARARRAAPQAPPTSRTRWGVPEGGSLLPACVPRTEMTWRVAMGPARATESIFPRSPASRTGPEGSAAGAPNVPDKVGGSGRGELAPRLRPQDGDDVARSNGPRPSDGVDLPEITSLAHGPGGQRRRRPQRPGQGGGFRKGGACSPLASLPEITSAARRPGGQRRRRPQRPGQGGGFRKGGACSPLASPPPRRGREVSLRLVLELFIERLTWTDVAAALAGG